VCVRVCVWLVTYTCTRLLLLTTVLVVMLTLGCILTIVCCVVNVMLSSGCCTIYWYAVYTAIHPPSTTCVGCMTLLFLN
jgi:hypothetical protein